MSKIRLLILIITIIVVAVFASLISLYARGFRFNTKTLKVSQNGLLVLKSVPDSAQIFINGELNSATNATITLPQGTYDVVVKKEGFFDWSKRLSIKKEEVTEATAHLFKVTPSFSAITFSGALNPVPSPDFTKIAYVVPPNGNNTQNMGLWIIETVNLPLGFARDPRKITDGDLSSSDMLWSPDSREILLITTNSIFLVDSSSYTPQSKLVNITTNKEVLLDEWRDEEKKKLTAQMRKLPDELESILERKTSKIIFSPDEDMILYQASGSATISSNLIRPIPGASTQKQERGIKDGHTYIYDIKEDRNFLIDEGNDLIISGGKTSGITQRRLSWYPTSRHVILAEPNKITIMDYDRTNQQVVYSGIYTAPHAFPTLSLDRLLFLTNFGATDKPPDIYSLNIK